MSHQTTVPSRRRRARAAAVAVPLALLVGLTACTDDPESTSAGESGTTEPAADACRPEELPEPIDPEEAAEADVDGTTVTLATHDSFAVSDGIFDTFTEETGVEVEVVSAGDAGTMVSQAILTAGDPVADVMFGIDTTFLCRGTEAGLFVPYRPAALDEVAEEHQIAVDDLATPIDVGDVCLNYSKTAFPDEADAPQSLDDLTDPAFADAFVTENPETSSPGLAFLLATIAEYGADGWEGWWADVRENGVEVTSGWEEAYNDSFGAGSGERSIVTSYASSPVADVVYSDPPRDEPAIGVVAESCFRQVELAGVLRGTEHPEAAALLVDFLLSPTFQEDIPLTMFVEPVHPDAELPEEYVAHRTVIEDRLTLTPAEIEAGRDEWTERWTEIVLR
ncbi:thiamine ABC transporter substrate-binding protein [Iamia sp. SCSIO 61187]|uniref:thiamine ABC transporter substrate-binding protein n=1 Tax=Iamia sp. SCSIO 61187 TaxID=2722752 RepID=UPI001C626D3B|nr:thiamine ABC transporter substrate-binding protein [Iamia sp. SCSIO 61187]QYG95243.1 thiamine ABC transporter substrate-binding protein [Iamia sp. SCSIO 61187]